MKPLLLLAVIGCTFGQSTPFGGNVHPPTPAVLSIANSNNLVSNVGCQSTTTTNCSITVNSTTAGDAAVMFVNVSTGSATAPSGCAGSGWQLASTTSPTGGTLFGFYCLNLTGGTTVFTSTVTTGDARAASFVEIAPSFNHSGFSFDNFGSVTGSCTTTCVGAPVTLTGSNDVIVQSFRGTTPTAISSPYAGFVAGGSGNSTALAYSLNTVSGTAPNWSAASSANQYGVAIALIGPF